MHVAALQKASALWFHTQLATLLLSDQGCLLGFPVHSFIHASFIHSIFVLSWGHLCTCSMLVMI